MVAGQAILRHRDPSCHSNKEIVSIGALRSDGNRSTDLVTFQNLHGGPTFLNWLFWASFSTYSSFLKNTQLKCRWLDWNSGSLVSEATALSTAPQHLFSVLNSLYWKDEIKQKRRRRLAHFKTKQLCSILAGCCFISCAPNYRPTSTYLHRWLSMRSFGR